MDKTAIDVGSCSSLFASGQSAHKATYRTKNVHSQIYGANLFATFPQVAAMKASLNYARALTVHTLSKLI